jgi:hypothetical protein
MVLIVGLFEQPKQADRALGYLESSGGYGEDVIVIVRTRAIEDYIDHREFGLMVKKSEGDETPGIAIGGIAELLAGTGFVTVPGLGSTLIAGDFEAKEGLLRALIDLGIDRDDANIYAEAVKRNGVLLIVRVSEAETEQATELLERAARLNVKVTGNTWKSRGWTAFDPTSEPGHDYPKLKEQ